MPAAFTLGLDFGTNSVRALVVRCRDGRELGSGVADYPSGRSGILLDPRDPLLARQHPADYLVGLERAVRDALGEARRQRGFDPSRIVGIGVDTTGSSPLPVDAHNRALADQPRWRRQLDAQCWLWKDHTSWREAARITELARELRPAWIERCGRTYSSEWFWAKLWHCAEVAPEVFAAADSWVELCDWIPSVLAGVSDPRAVRRSVCAAGHKALYADEWGGLPDAEFLARLDPRLAALRDRLYTRAEDASVAAGHLCPAWARRLGLRAGLPIAMGAFDVHHGAIGCGVAEGTLVKVIGTSTCDCGVVAVNGPVPTIPGICGIVRGSILPGLYGVEAGQSAVGDIFRWWVEGVLGDPGLHPVLTAAAAKQAPGESGLLALDWNNGNRTILVDQRLTGLLVGQTLHTTSAEVYRALIEATAFGARAILERLAEGGMPVRRIVCAGGIAEKNPLLMQIYADVTGCTLQVSASSQACALGAAMVAAVLAGAQPDFPTAQRTMVKLRRESYRPNPAARRTYHELYALYRELHDSFGGVRPGIELGPLMKRLLAIKEAARSAPVRRTSRRRPRARRRPSLSHA